MTHSGFTSNQEPYQLLTDLPLKVAPVKHPLLLQRSSSFYSHSPLWLGYLDVESATMLILTSKTLYSLLQTYFQGNQCLSLLIQFYFIRVKKNDLDAAKNNIDDIGVIFSKKYQPIEERRLVRLFYFKRFLLQLLFATPTLISFGTGLYGLIERCILDGTMNKLNRQFLSLCGDYGDPYDQGLKFCGSSTPFSKNQNCSLYQCGKPLCEEFLTYCSPYAEVTIESLVGLTVGILSAIFFVIIYARYYHEQFAPSNAPELKNLNSHSFYKNIYKKMNPRTQHTLLRENFEIKNTIGTIKKQINKALETLSVKNEVLLAKLPLKPAQKIMLQQEELSNISCVFFQKHSKKSAEKLEQPILSISLH